MVVDVGLTVVFELNGTLPIPWLIVAELASPVVAQLNVVEDPTGMLVDANDIFVCGGV